jgi:hypothetical protein
VSASPTPPCSIKGYTFHEVPGEFRAKMKFMPMKKDEAHKRSQTAVAYSHYMALLHVRENIQGPVIICEDDAWLRFEVPFHLLPTDAATLLAGTLAHPTNFGAYFDSKAIVSTFTEGVNTIDYTKYRWFGQVAIYYPTNDIAALLECDLRQAELGHGTRRLHPQDVRQCRHQAQSAEGSAAAPHAQGEQP